MSLIYSLLAGIASVSQYMTVMDVPAVGLLVGGMKRWVSPATKYIQLYHRPTFIRLSALIVSCLYGDIMGTITVRGGIY